MMPRLLSMSLLLTGVWIAPPARAEPPAPSASRRNVDKARERARARLSRNLVMRRILSHRVEHVEFDDRLEDVIAWFKERGVRNLIINWNLLEKSNVVSRDTPINLVLQDVTLGELLTVVLELASDQAVLSREQLTFHITHGVLRIAPREYFDRKLFTKTYYVEDLLQRVTADELAPYLVVGSEFAYVREVQPVVRSGAAAQAPVVDVLPTGTNIGPGDPERGVPDFEQIREEELEKLIDLIRTIRPETWDTGGGPGTITAFGERLVVTQTIEMHEIIGGAF